MQIGLGLSITAPRGASGVVEVPPAITDLALTGLDGGFARLFSPIGYTATLTGSPAPAQAREWQAGGVAISGQTDATITPGAALDGASLRLVLTATNTAGTDTETSAAATVTYPEPQTNGPLDPIDGDEGDAVSIDLAGLFFDGNPANPGRAPSLTWALKSGESHIPGFSISGSTYATSALDLAADGVSTILVGTNSWGSVEATIAIGTVTAASTDPAVLSNFTLIGDPVDSIAFDSDQDGTAYVLIDTNATRTGTQVEAGGGVFDDSFGLTGGAGFLEIDTTSIAPGAGYYLHVVLENANGYSNVISSGPHAINYNYVSHAFTGGFSKTSGLTTGANTMSTVTSQLSGTTKDIWVWIGTGGSVQMTAITVNGVSATFIVGSDTSGGWWRARLTSASPTLSVVVTTAATPTAIVMHIYEVENGDTTPTQTQTASASATSVACPTVTVGAGGVVLVGGWSVNNSGPPALGFTGDVSEETGGETGGFPSSSGGRGNVGSLLSVGADTVDVTLTRSSSAFIRVAAVALGVA